MDEKKKENKKSVSTWKKKTSRRKIIPTYSMSSNNSERSRTKREMIQMRFAVDYFMNKRLQHF